VRLLEPLVADPSAPLARPHPLAKIVAALVLMLAVFITVDIVTSGIVVAALILASRYSGLPPRSLAARAVPLLIAAVSLGVFNAVLSQNAAAGAAIALRVIGVSLAGMLAVATIDPTDLADALVEHARAPSRFVVGALAAFRLFPLFSREWDVLGLARRARGVEADRTVVDRMRAFPGRALGLLVAGIRRATRLALAMDARGFGARDCRTLARPRPLTPRDAALVAGALVLAIGATAISIAVGSWRPLLGA
jgi:energy-coupling factor transport system permease protein